MNVTKGPRERDGEAWRRVAELQRSSWQLHTVAVASPSSISLHLLPAPRPHSRLRTERNTLGSSSTYWAPANGSHMHGLVKLVPALLLLTTSASTCLQHSRNHVQAICAQYSVSLDYKL